MKWQTVLSCCRWRDGAEQGSASHFLQCGFWLILSAEPNLPALYTGAAAAPFGYRQGFLNQPRLQS
jgi:hypothetical protein